MDILIFCRDALVNSLIGSIGTAMAFTKVGAEAGVIFTNEALAALGGIGAFQWSPLFAGRNARAKVNKNATALGIPVGEPKDSRWTDLSRLFKAAQEAGVKLYACPLWTNILEVKEKLPPEVIVIEQEDLLKAMQKAKTVIGGL